MKALTTGEKPLASEVSVSLEIQSEFSLMNVSVRTDRPESVQAIANTVADVLRELPKREYTPKELSRVVVPNKVEEIKLEEKLHYYGIMKAPYLATCGYAYLENYIQNLSSVTPAKVSEVARKYFADPQFAACALVPAPGVE
jgi:predicted Zn-dependent peptidase